MYTKEQCNLIDDAIKAVRMALEKYRREEEIIDHYTLTITSTDTLDVSIKFKEPDPVREVSHISINPGLTE